MQIYEKNPYLCAEFSNNFKIKEVVKGKTV